MRFIFRYSALLILVIMISSLESAMNKVFVRRPHTTKDFGNDLSLFDAEYDVLYACSKNPYDDQPCTCENESLSCSSFLEHANVQIRDSNFVVKNANFAINSITELNKDKILPGREHIVENLDFSRNKIATIENGTFNKFTSLKTLNIGGNRLSFVSAEVFTPQLGSTLLELNLESNDFHKLSAIYFQSLVNLNSLSLAFNKQMDFSSSECIFPLALKNMKKLDLSSCYIRELNENVFINLKNLEFLILKLNSLSSIPTAINGLLNLQYLDLSVTNIDAINNTTFENHVRLQQLHLDGNNIKFIDDCTFCRLSNLKEIHLDHNPLLSYIHENAFGAFTTGVVPVLDKFFIQSCNISTLPEKLLDWNNTKNIHFENNPFVCNCSMAWIINDFTLLSRFSSIESITEYASESTCSSPSGFENVKLANVPKPFCINSGNIPASFYHIYWLFLAFYYSLNV